MKQKQKTAAKKTSKVRKSENLLIEDPGACLTVHPHLKQYTGYCFYKAAAKFRSIVDEHLSPLGVIAPQFGILSLLAHTGSVTQVELGKFMAIDKATMVRLIDLLEDKKYLKRISQSLDRRTKKIEVTKMGLEILGKMNIARKEAENRFLSVLSQEERSQLREIVSKLIST
jgi:DNA-binding MarR family transcriptional regulator